MEFSAISDLFRSLDRELWLVTARAGGRRGGLIATFVSQASIVPDLPRVAVGLARQHHTHELVEASGAFALHLLDEARLDWVWRFGLRSGRAADKLEGIETRVGVAGCPIVLGLPGWLECRVEARLDTGDRTLFLAGVVDGRLERPGPVLTMRGMIERAPAERRAELAEQMAEDIATDRAAIAAWRSRNPMPGVEPTRPRPPGARTA